MGQLTLLDNIPPVIRASSTTATLAATHMGQPTRITIGGQQYRVSSLITLSTGSVGANGLDAGVLGAIQLWYVYAVVHSASFTVAMVASLTGPSAGPTMPSGYSSSYKLVGAFYTNGSNLIGSMVQISGAISTEWMSAVMVLGATTTPPTKGTTSIDEYIWRRVGDSVELHWQYGQTGAGTAGVGNYRFFLPGSLSIDTNKQNFTILQTGMYGVVQIFDGTREYQGFVNGVGASASSVAFYMPRFWSGTTPNIFPTLGVFAPTSLAGSFATANLQIHMQTKPLPISGWTSTLLG